MHEIQMRFPELIKKIENHPGVAAKHPAGNILGVLGGMNEAEGIGDDCGYIPAGDGFLLFTADSIRDRLLEDPFFAGFCGINVVVNDIYAMGGTPLAVVDTVYAAGDDGEWVEDIVGGMKVACKKFGVPLLGGHITANAGFRALSVSGAGSAKRLITTFGARQGDSVIAVYDLGGEHRSPLPVWDSSTGDDADSLRTKLGVMVGLAEKGMATAARDISNAGVIGTLAMLAEASGVGATIDLEAIPRPPGMSLEEWIFIYPSYGFILTVPPSTEPEVLSLFDANGLTAARTGTVREGGGVTVRHGKDESAVFSSGIVIFPGEKRRV